MKCHISTNVNILGVLGLLIEIIGVIILFNNGLPSPITKNESFALSEIVIPNLYEPRIRFLAKLSLVLIIIGFVFQFLSYIFFISF